MKANVLVIEDEREIADLIGLYLQQEGITFTVCETAEDGLSVYNKGGIDLIVLDINLPGMDGFEFLETLRKGSSVPVIIVSARKADEDLILALGIGADEYVEKPFSPKVLAARIRAVLRRCKQSQAHGKEVLRFGAFVMDPAGRTLEKHGVPIVLPSRQFDVLLYLVKNAGLFKTATEIYDAVWGSKYGDIATVAVHIQRLRKNIEEDPNNPKLIINTYGAGYKFNADVDVDTKEAI